jgi:hypothetical protein
MILRDLPECQVKGIPLSVIAVGVTNLGFIHGLRGLLRRMNLLS